MANTIKVDERTKISLIDQIYVEDLFNTFTYRLTAATTPGPESGKLLLLYGENGAGKTTLLNLIYHLMNPEPFGGHRSYIGEIPFSRFDIKLTSGLTISASRAKSPDPGPYDITLSKDKKEIAKWTWIPDKTKKKEDKEYERLCQLLNDLGITFHYLRDTRRLEGRSEERRYAMHRSLLSEIEEGRIVIKGEEEKATSTDIQLRMSIEGAVEWFRKQALSGTNVGYTSVHSIYKDIIQRVVTYGSEPGAQAGETLKNLIADLERLGQRNATFAKFGLTPELDIAMLTGPLADAGSQRLSILRTVLGPYLEGHKARLDALQELQRVMESFVSLLNEFYAHKNATIHLDEGLVLKSDKGNQLNPAVLSSGEKQLLLLLCNAISARREGTILIIDEPEISLNVEWQRRLIPALTTCLSGTAFQIMLATHSIEILSQYRDYVAPLENIKASEN